jgi:hypothetical protein
MIVSAVGISVDTLSPAPSKQAEARDVQLAMERAVHQCVAEGIPLDGPVVKYRMHEARLNALRFAEED